jgi:hypothetical protein
LLLTPRRVWYRAYANFLMSSRLPEYRALLNSALRAGYEIVSVRQFWRLICDGSVDPTGRYLVLRHDIDTDPATARAMWSIVQSLGISGSFYFRLSTLDVDLMQQIESYGGEAGYHYEEIATIAKHRAIRRPDVAIRAIPEARELFVRNLVGLRRMTGLPLEIVGSHGDFVNRHLRLPNWAMLIDRSFRSDAGVELEVYDHTFMRHVTSRHSDVEYPQTWRPAGAGAALAFGSPVVYLLVHPRHWRANRAANARDDARRFREGIRYRFPVTRLAGTDVITTAAVPSTAAIVDPAFAVYPVSGRGSAGPQSGPAAASPSDGRTVLVQVPPKYEAERRYILGLVLSEWLGLDVELSSTVGTDVTIRLAGDPLGRELRLPDVLFSTSASDWLTQRSMPATPLTRGSPSSLPILFGVGRPGEAMIQESPTGLALTVDVFGSVFFILSRYEEVVGRYADDHGRFPAFASIAAVEDFLERPLVDEYVDVLWGAMQSLWPMLERRPVRSGIRLTHDVDQPWSALGLSPLQVTRGIAGDLVRRRDPELALRRTRSLWAARRGSVEHDPFDTFDFLMEASERIGLRSTFYFQACRDGGPYSATYRVGDPRVVCLLRRLHDRGHEIGLHGSYASFESADVLRDEFDTLRATCHRIGIDQESWSVRQHYLRLQVPGTWRNHEAVGLAFDSTLGFADFAGFRAGTCHEFPVFDLEARRALRLRERPLTLMDVTLFRYMGLARGDAARHIRAVGAACRSYGGETVICYHNSTLPRAQDKAFYRRLVTDLAAVLQ